MAQPFRATAPVSREHAPRSHLPHAFAVCACLLYAGVLCLMYRDKATEYVDVYWQAITDVLEGTPVGKPDPEVSRCFLLPFPLYAS